MTTEFAAILLAMTAVTYPMRLLPALWLMRLQLSQPVADCVRLVPVCIMISMIVIDLCAGWASAAWRLLALLPVLVVNCLTDSIGAGVLVGVLAYSALMAL